MLLGGDENMKTLGKYLKVWMRTTLAVFSADLSNRFAASIFIIGKVLRFLFFLGFLYLLVGKTKVLAGFSLYQVVFFFLTFNLIDVTAQLFLRGVYHFRPNRLDPTQPWSNREPFVLLAVDLTGQTCNASRTVMKEVIFTHLFSP